MGTRFIDDDFLDEIEYPETDGLPIAENTEQFLWIVKFFSGFFAWHRNDPNVFVACDLFWYPVEDEPTIRTAPDTMIAFGRSQGHRRSYRQWREADIAPQVVFEISSPKYTATRRSKLFEFYHRFGVEEYYLYDPDEDLVEGWQRNRNQLIRIRRMNGYISPRLDVRFDTTSSELVVYQPDGQPFLAPGELAEELEQKRMEHARLNARQEKRRADRMAAKLRELGIDPDTL